MLVLSRKIGERIVIGSGVEIAVVDVCGGRVRLGVVAPREISVRRMELLPRREALPPGETALASTTPVHG